jgi:UDP-N-acetylglucosamine diphosphorylase/glucosamine-1-phosphate N-acetyltransferase
MSAKPTAQVLLIEPDSVDLFQPFSSTRCLWELRLGFYTVIERWRAVGGTVHVTTYSNRQFHAASFASRDRECVVSPLPTIILLATAVVAHSEMLRLIECCSTASEPTSLFIDDQCVGCFVTSIPSDPADISSMIASVEFPVRMNVKGAVINALWDFSDFIPQCVQIDADIFRANNQNCVSATSVVHETVVIDDSGGPVIIGDNCVIHPYVVITGPAAIAHNSSVLSFSQLSGAILGTHSKVRGEVYYSVFQEFCNKQHEGFCGHSYIGAWSNLAAGSTTSNLKSTYGKIRVVINGQRFDTHRMWLGALLGEHTKTSIGAMLVCGFVGGAFAMIPKDYHDVEVPAFSFFMVNEKSVYRLSDALSTADLVMQRRNKQLTLAERQLFEHLFAEIPSTE